MADVLANWVVLHIKNFEVWHFLKNVNKTLNRKNVYLVIRNVQRRNALKVPKLNNILKPFASYSVSLQLKVFEFFVKIKAFDFAYKIVREIKRVKLF